MLSKNMYANLHKKKEKTLILIDISQNEQRQKKPYATVVRFHFFFCDRKSIYGLANAVYNYRIHDTKFWYSSKNSNFGNLETLSAIN